MRGDGGSETPADGAAVRMVTAEKMALHAAVRLCGGCGVVVRMRVRAGARVGAIAGARGERGEARSRIMYRAT